MKQADFGFCYGEFPYLCSALVAWPLGYFALVAEGDAYLFLARVLLASLSGLVLAANSLFCFVRYRRLEPFWAGLLFLLVGVIGVLEAWHFLPQFKMN